MEHFMDSVETPKRNYGDFERSPSRANLTAELIEPETGLFRLL
jgi:hypothetical protein